MVQTAASIASALIPNFSKSLPAGAEAPKPFMETSLPSSPIYLYHAIPPSASQAILRRQEGETSAPLVLGGLKLDRVARELTVDGKTVEYNNFVGYGDGADFARIKLKNDATVSFNVTATDKAKFVIYSFTEGVDKKGNVKYTVKALQTTELKKPKTATEYAASTKALSLQSGVYYIAVQSTNAAKGGCAYYNVELNTSDCSGLPDAPLEEISDASDALSLDLPGSSAGTSETMLASAALDLAQIAPDERNSGWLAAGSLA